MKRFVVSLCSLGLLAAAPASADLSFSFDVSNIVSPDNPSTTVEVWAHVDPGHYAFAGALWDVVATTDSGGLSDPFSVLHYLGTSDGNVAQNGDSVTHIIAGQLQFPLNNDFADTASPILVWTATWTTANFKPRTVSLETVTEKYFLYLDETGVSENVFDDQFQEALGSIKVVPAPASAAVIGGLAFIGRRRRA